MYAAMQRAAVLWIRPPHLKMSPSVLERTYTRTHVETDTHSQRQPCLSSCYYCIHPVQPLVLSSSAYTICLCAWAVRCVSKWRFSRQPQCICSFLEFVTLCLTHTYKLVASLYLSSFFPNPGTHHYPESLMKPLSDSTRLKQHN